MKTISDYKRRMRTSKSFLAKKNQTTNVKTSYRHKSEMYVFNKYLNKQNVTN